MDLSRTSGFTAGSRPFLGTYCLTPARGIDPATLPAVVSVDWRNTFDPEGNASASYDTNGEECDTNQFSIHTERQSVSGAYWTRSTPTISASLSSCPRRLTMRAPVLTHEPLVKCDSGILYRSQTLPLALIYPSAWKGSFVSSSARSRRGRPSILHIIPDEYWVSPGAGSRGVKRVYDS